MKYEKILWRLIWLGIVLYLALKSISNYNETFYYLEDIEQFKIYIQEYFNIIYITKIDYNTNDLNRYAFILEKIIK